jgi:hypothetical protein
VIAIGANFNGEMSPKSESSVDHELADNRLRKISSPQVEPKPLTSAAVLASTPVELLRYRGAAKDGGNLEYVFEAGEQNSPTLSPRRRRLRSLPNS